MSNDDKPMSGLDWLEFYGACCCIFLAITSPLWLGKFMRWAMDQVAA